MVSHRRGPVAVCALALAAILLASAVSGCDWFGDGPVVALVTGDSFDLYIDGDDTLHILYTVHTRRERGTPTSAVYYGRRESGGSLSREQVLPAAGADRFADAIAVGVDGTVHAFIRDGSRAIHAVRGADAAWSTSDLHTETAGPVGDVEVDGAGGLHLCYSVLQTDADGKARPRYAHRASGSAAWTHHEIAIDQDGESVDYAEASALAVAAGGRVHLVFGREGDTDQAIEPRVYYTRFDTGSPPATATVLSGSATGTAEADVIVDSAGAVHVAFLGYEVTPNLKYLVSEDGGAVWSPNDRLPFTGHRKGLVVDSTPETGYSPGLRLEASNPQVIYVGAPAADSASRIIKVASRDSQGQWSVAATTPEISPRESRIAQSDDGAGVAYVLFARDVGERLGAAATAYAELALASRPAAGSWTVEVLDIPENHRN